ncbi:PTS system D-fructose-specific IIA component (F1P-forming), Frc family /PTS system D-fructose-specific IIB component (F1P-forming), Frc family /PTS system D-fructose-specific IIC component (F1P-forming), Frc family [Oribacterium sp. KHPX15]|uniref:PTS fructose transporter subunit IIABC n=1 Tax=Oribacterium sp. KHPX15 TaxID=1855342 RepID=UPI0008998CA5|nr:fructose-specific PTS transporter subunit EIIC [Oribacterium sp. KHPX15]SDZ80498.1 PTS system D-fructose-specific IIA component (F1P-forming), Frc family /PTS system D-fructose-specific IIB component (F1P-forming), Frc family /PTS system D-fructose-specific IIC component (F1P-forming), Frc family [Oribacterium sp. KHPX15]
MRVRDLLSPSCIDLNGIASSKTNAIEKMVDLMEKRGNLTDKEVYKKGVFAREEESTTGIGEGIAIPHCKSDSVKEPGLAAMVLPEGVEYDALDGEPVNLIFLIAAPNTKDNVHLDVLSRLSTLLMDEKFVSDLRAAKSPEEFLNIIEKAEDAKDAEEAAKASAAAPSDGYEVLAVTSCPTGIAHTYMAAEALEKAGKEMGVKIKVETRGSGGAKNVVTADEIKAAKAIIIAADAKVPVDRFAGKPVLEAHVAEGINKPKELINKALSGTVPVFSGSGASENEASDKAQGNAGHQAYKHLMSGVSHMLPFVIGGGILVAIAFLVDTLAGYGATAGGSFGSATPLAAFLKYVGGQAMGLMIPVLAGYIAYSIADRPGLAVGFTGGMLAASGNAAIGGYMDTWTNLGSNGDGFSQFISKFAFSADGVNTVSGFLGAIVIGFISGYVVNWLKKSTEKLPQSLAGIRPILIYPLCGVFIVGVLMCFIFNPIIGFINTALSAALNGIYASGQIWLLGLLLGAMMAIDMGGPINKAAYVFGSGMLAQAAVDPSLESAAFISMAAVMAGGMVPPVGIALACKLFPKKFTAAEKSSWISNIIMGASFITEGAIPFAAADPGHVIPATMAGAGVAGLLSALFGCTLRAPHGGIFVFATVGNPVMYIVAWLAGSAVTCALLGILKKDAE